MIFTKIAKLILAEIKENIDRFFCQNYIPTSIYINFFKFRTKLKIKRDLSICLKGKLFRLHEVIENENIYWHFPSDLRYRGLQGTLTVLIGKVG